MTQQNHKEDPHTDNKLADQIDCAIQYFAAIQMTQVAIAR